MYQHQTFMNKNEWKYCQWISGTDEHPHVYEK